MIKVPIAQQGAAVTYYCSDGYLSHGPGHVLIYYWQQTEQPNIPTDPGKERTMTVDNTTRLPAVIRSLAADGTEVFTPLTRVEYQQAKDAQGNPLFWQYTTETETYTEYEQPILEPVVVPRTIGEYDAVKWWHWNRLNTAHQPAIEEMIEEGIRRRVGLSDKPYHFVVTEEFVAAFGDTW